MARAEHGEHALLERERSGSELSGFRPRGAALVEPLSAGLPPASPAARAGPGLPTLSRVQAAVAGQADQQSGGASFRSVLRAAVLEQDPVAGAGEDDRELPGPLPASAALGLDAGAGPRQARRAVRGRARAPAAPRRPRATRR